jgi:pimeloyl-[acyl-carrier protein] methyl ester esterase
LQQFVASDGVAIAFESEGAGRPVVLLHGLMAHGGFFEPQRPLSGQFQVIRVDLRGHGGSPADGASVTVERLARDVSELADQLDLHDAICVGWSLGASVLWRLLAGPSSERFAGAVVIDMTPRVLNEGDWSLGLSGEVCEARRQAIADDFKSFAASAGAAIFAQPVGADMQKLADWAAAEFARNDSAAIGALWTSLMDEDLRALLPRIAQPTLVVHGAHSHLYGADTADHLVAALPNASALRFDRSGHSPHLEQPELFNRAIQSFAAGLPPVRFTQNAE